MCYFVRGRLLFLRPVFRMELISSSKFWWGLPKGDLAKLRFLGGGGGVAELKGVTSFFQGKANTLEDTMVAIFSDIIFVSNYHGSKEEAINLIPEYLIDIIHKLL